MKEILSLPKRFEEFSDARKNGFLKVKALKEQGKKVAFSDELLGRKSER